MRYVEVQGEAVPAVGFGTWRLKGEACERAVAHALRGDANGVDRELGELKRIREKTDFKSMTDGGVPAPVLCGSMPDAGPAPTRSPSSRGGHAATHSRC